MQYYCVLQCMTKYELVKDATFTHVKQLGYAAFSIVKSFPS